VRGATGSPGLEVTSPTFLIDNVYAGRDGTPVHHLDAYRLHDAADASVLALPHIFSNEIAVVEWPQRLAPAALPQEYLLVQIISELERPFPAAWRTTLVPSAAQGGGRDGAAAAGSHAAAAGGVLQDLLSSNGAHGGHTPVDVRSPAARSAAADMDGTAQPPPSSQRVTTVVAEDTGRRAILLHPVGRWYEQLCRELCVELPRVELQ
jgi:hypothetical protein